MRDRPFQFEVSEKECTLLSASFYLTKYVLAHVNGMRLNLDTPDEHTKICRDALTALEEGSETFDGFGTKIVTQLELRNQEKWI